ISAASCPRRGSRSGPSISTSSTPTALTSGPRSTGSASRTTTMHSAIRFPRRRRHLQCRSRRAEENAAEIRATACESRASRKMRRVARAKPRTSARLLLFLRASPHPLCDCARSFRRDAGRDGRLPEPALPLHALPRYRISAIARRGARGTFPHLQAWRNAASRGILPRSGLAYRYAPRAPRAFLPPRGPWQYTRRKFFHARPCRRSACGESARFPLACTSLLSTRAPRSESFLSLRATWLVSPSSGSSLAPRFHFQAAFVACTPFGRGFLARRRWRFGGQPLKQAAITGHVAIMFFESTGEEMSAGIVGDEIQVMRVSGTDNGTQGCVSWICDRPGGKAAMQICIVRRGNVEILGSHLGRGLARKIERVLNRGIALQGHTQF